MAGRTIPCPRCGANVTLPSAPTTGSATPRRRDADTPAIAISTNLIVGTVVGVTLLVIVLVVYFGPWAVTRQWSAMSSRANTEVTDVVDFALKAYESQHNMYDASQSHNVPMITGQAGFVPPTLVFSLPRHVSFLGKTNQGNYHGTYDTSNGEIEVDIETGGFTVGGMVDVKAASGSFHATGREKDGVVSAEADGQPLQIVMRKHKRDDE
jgi:hypothetical protein